MRPDLKPSRTAIAAAARRGTRVARFLVTRHAAKPFTIPL